MHGRYNDMVGEGETTIIRLSYDRDKTHSNSNCLFSVIYNLSYMSIRKPIMILIVNNFYLIFFYNSASKSLHFFLEKFEIFTSNYFSDIYSIINMFVTYLNRNIHKKKFHVFLQRGKQY